MSLDDTNETGEARQPIKNVNVKLPLADINRLRYIVRHRYPDDRQMMAKTIRELIREEYARLTAKETTGK